MTAPASHRRASTGGAVLLALALTVSACGGGSDAKMSEKPTETASTSAPATPPTAAPTTTPSVAALSPFEDEAPVKAARAFLAAVARAVNAGDRRMEAVATLATASGVSVIAQTVTSDLDRPATLPGPQPFTPVHVSVRGGEATISTCMKTHGWSLDAKTQKRWEEPKVSPILIDMKRVGGVWKFDNTAYGTFDCSGVPVAGVRW